MGENWEQELLKNAVQQCLFDDIEGEADPGAAIKPGELPRFDVPRTDNQRLLNYQYEYRNGDDSALGRMYSLAKTIAWKYINKIGQKNRKVRYLSRLDKESKAADAASYIIEQLMTRPDFVMTSSVTGYLWLRVIHELFYYREVDKIVDFVDLARFFKEGTEDEEEADD